MFERWHVFTGGMMSASGIDALTRTMSSALDEVYRETGLIGMAIFAGPEPDQGGNICIRE